MKEHTQIDSLVNLLAKLPGFGKRSARRAVLQLLKKKESLMLPLSEQLRQVAESIVNCGVCGNVDTHSPCHICTDARRDGSLLCVVEEVADLWAFERSGAFKGHYHVLGGTLSAMEGRGPQDLSIDALVDRAANPHLREVILATNSTVDGHTTAHYVTQRLSHLPITVSRLAQGIPFGGELDYLDDGTLGTAFASRMIAKN